MNVDGAQIFRSTTNSLWLVQLYQNYLPKKIRYHAENVLLSTLWYGRNKPNAFHLLSMLAQEIEQSEVSVFNGTELIEFIPVMIMASCDIPARALLQNMKQPTGKSSCAICLHPGEPVLNVKKKTTIRYIKRDHYELRTHSDTVNKASKINGTDSIDGIKGYSCMLLFNDFNIIDNFAIDFMHGVALGIVKDILQIWFGMKKIPAVNNGLKIKLQNPNERKILSSRIEQLKPPMHFRRKPRALLDLANFKATEFLHLLLYYIRFAVGNLLSTKVIKNIELLSAAIFILCKPELNEQQLRVAGDYLNKFTDDFEIIYGKGAVTMNCHLLRHYENMVRNCGPLWCHSLFGFESSIGALKKFVSGTNSVVIQMANKYVASKTINSFPENNIHTELPVPAVQIFVCQQKRIAFNDHHRKVFEEHNIDLPQTAYARFKQNKHTFTSLLGQETRSADFFVQMNEMCDKMYGTAEFYFKFKEICYVFLNLYEQNYVHYHLTEIKKKNVSRIFPCTHIEKKLIYLRVNSIEYLAEELELFNCF